MTYDMYWNEDCMLVKYYKQSFRMQQDRKNEELWLQGYYFYEALCDVSPILQAFAKNGTKLDKLVEQINDFIEGLGLKGKFATLIVCLLNVKTGELYMCNAGDNIVLLDRNVVIKMNILDTKERSIDNRQAVDLIITAIVGIIDPAGILAGRVGGCPPVEIELSHPVPVFIGRIQGLDCLRIHCFDRQISDVEGHLVDPDGHLAKLDYLIALCASNGIVTVLTPMAHWGGGGDWKGGFCDHYCKDGYEPLVGDEKLWTVQTTFLREFAEHRNPHRGNLSYAEDPAIPCFELVNEPEYAADFTGEQAAAYANRLLEGIRRSGTLKSEMVFEVGKTHTTVYELPFGSLPMEVRTDSIRQKLSERGGLLEICYRIAVGEQMRSGNSFRMQIKRKM